MFLANKLNKGGSLSSPDAQFNYVTMLLHGDGTNGAQNNTFVDSSTNNFSITRVGDATQGFFSPYGSNWSNYFPNSGSVQYSGVSTALQFTGDFTIEGWFNLANFNNAPAGGNPGLIGNGTGNWLLVIPGGEYNFYSAGSVIIQSSGAVASANVWNHFAVVRSGSTLKIYHNGVSVATATNSSTLSIGSTVTVGSNGTGGIGSILGYISNVRVVKGTAVYTANFTPPTAPLTAISGTQLLTAQANRFIDSSSNNFSNTIEAGPSVQRFNPFGSSTAYSTSVIGGSGYFDGSDYLTFSPSTSFAFGTGDFTIEFWVNTGGGSANGAVLDSTTNGSYWAIRFSGTTLFYQSASGITNLATPTISTLGQNAWTHVAIVRASGTTKIYANGVQVSSTADSTNYTATTTYQIGKSSDNAGYAGYFSDIRVVKGTAVYTAAFTPPTAPLTAITNTSLLTNYTNGAIFDNAMMNDLVTVGNAQISTSVVKYGTGSMYFDGTGDALRSQNTPNLQFSTGDFTVECWLYQTATNTYPGILEIGNHVGDSGGMLFIASNGSTITAYNGSAGFLGTATAPSLNTWNHIAWVRNNGTFKIYVNGVGNTGVSFTTNLNVSTAVTIGADQFLNSAYTYTGYIDDLRITKGFARYTANFTPPTAAFPNTGPV